MPLVSGKALYEVANRYNFAICGFNVNNLETLKAVLEVAQELNSPIFLQTSPKAIKYMGENFVKLLKDYLKDSTVPVALHLDHGKSLKDVLFALRVGYTSVMIDASDKSFEENVRITQEVVSLCLPLGVSVEAELGVLREGSYTEPELAKEFILKTGVDALAVAVGTSHGAYKFKGEPKLNFKVLEEIKLRTRAPLVLHGASSVYKDLKDCLNLEEAVGVPEEELREAIRLGINKINTDTDLRMAFLCALREYLNKNPKEIDYRKHLLHATNRVKEVVRRRILLSGSEGKASLF